MSMFQFHVRLCASPEARAWTRLSPDEQLTQWQSFLDALDAGDAGYHRFYPVLMPLWARGDIPETLNEEHVEAAG
jgi:hypothetical protein